MIGRVVRRAGSSSVARRVVVASPALRETARRFVAGPDAPSAVIAAESLHDLGLRSTVHLRGGEVRTRDDADQQVRAYAELATRLASAGCAPASELSVTLGQLGLQAAGGWDVAVERLREVVANAADRGLFVTVDAEPGSSVDETLAAVAEVRQEHRSLGVTLQARLRRTEDDCRMLAGPGSRVRLVVGYADPTGDPAASVDPEHVDDAFLCCLDVLMRGQGYPMVATHNRRLIDAAQRLARETGRKSPEWELQMLLGVNRRDQRALAADGVRVRVHVPYGPDWYAVVVQRIAEQPSNLRLLAQALLPREQLAADAAV